MRLDSFILAADGPGEAAGEYHSQELKKGNSLEI